jgi:Fe2+ or Zn2+ uptake regulation protein
VPTSSDYERMLRGAGLRVTRPRLAVLSVVHDHPHADTDWTGAVWKGFGPVSRQAVCDVLLALSAAGLVRRFPPSAPDASGYDVGKAEVTYCDRCPECVSTSTSGG